MRNTYTKALALQILCVCLGIIHQYIKPLGSDFIFGVLILALMVGTYLIWNAIRNPNIQPLQRRLGLILGSLPIGVLISTLLYLSTTKM
jgi:hypothetical protein